MSLKRVRITTELSCYVDNTPGMLGQIAKKMADNGIDIIGIQSYEGQLQSLVRLCVNNMDVAEKVLRDVGVDLISRPEVMEVLIRNEVGGLAEVTSLLGQHGININSLYATDGVDETFARAFIRVDDIELAKKILEKELPHLPINGDK